MLTGFGYKIVFYLGIILIIVPFLGIPTSWKDTSIFIVALLLIFISILEYISFKKHDKNIEEEIELEEENFDIDENIESEDKIKDLNNTEDEETLSFENNSSYDDYQEKDLQ